MVEVHFAGETMINAFNRALIILEIDSQSGGESCTNEWKLVDVANNSQRGSNERIRGKMEKLKQFTREAARRDAVAELGVSLEDRDEVQRLKESLLETQAANHREREKAEVSSNIRSYKTNCSLIIDKKNI